MHDKIGRHISASGSIDLTLDLAKATLCNSMQIFVSSPMQWKVKELKQEEVASFARKKKELDVAPIVVHMPYLPNLASPNPEIYPKSVETLRLNMERCNQLGAEYLVIHLGSTMGRPKPEAMRGIADGINSTIGIFDGMLLLENQAGQKNTVGSDLGDLADLWDSISHKKVGYCIDTCHAFGAGYDIRKPEAIDQIEKILGWEKVHVIHANDSKFDLGEHKDRHENIGKGFIGEKGFRTFLGHAKIRDKPIIMETPTSRQVQDRKEIELVRSLIG